MNEVTRILSAIDQGDSGAARDLLPLVYEELRKLASQRLSQESPGQTLQATALVHEAYVRLVGGRADRWDSRAHFFAAAAEAMRRILIDRARARGSEKRGGRRRRLKLAACDLSIDDVPDDLIDLDQALTRLAEEDTTKAELVKLRFFAGLSLADAGKLLGISPATADRYWSYARAWLFHELGGTIDPGER